MAALYRCLAKTGEDAVDAPAALPPDLPPRSDSGDQLRPAELTHDAHVEIERPVRPSVLDRLIDEDPRSNVEPPLTRSQSVRQFKTALQRDLEWLLNARRIITPVPDEFPELARSVFTFGLPDITSMSKDSRESFERLRAHDPDGRRRVRAATHGRDRAISGKANRSCCASCTSSSTASSGSIRRRSASCSTRGRTSAAR